MDKVKTFAEAKQLLAEFDGLPDDLGTRLNWEGYERLPEYVCTCVCGQRHTYQMDIGNLRFTVEKEGALTLERHKDVCYGHDFNEEEL